MRVRQDFDAIISAPHFNSKWPLYAQLWFHQFNPNGACRQKRALDGEIDKLIEQGAVKSGWWFAHGLGNRYFYEGVLACKPTTGRLKVHMRIQMLLEENEKVRARIATVQG
jgi:hypothetical protein